MSEQEKELDSLEKRIRMAAELARIEAKIHGTYTVYMDKDGDIVREYPDGTIKKKRDGKNE